MGLYTRPISPEPIMQRTVTGDHEGIGALGRLYWLPICNRLRTSPEVEEPEVWFRIVHRVQDSHGGAPVAACREQGVEIVFGAKGPFEDGNVSAVTRQVPAERVVSVARKSEAVSGARGAPGGRCPPQWR